MIRRVLAQQWSSPTSIGWEPGSYASAFRDVFVISGPLALGMTGYAISLVVDRLALAAHSKSTLAASGPAVFTAMTLITFSAGSIYFFQPRFVRAYATSAPDDFSNLAVELRGSLIFGLVAVTLLLLCFPLAAALSLHSNRPAEIATEEATYLRLMGFAGSLMVLNAIGASLFSALGKTSTVMRVSMVGHLTTAACSVTLVLGYLGLPRMGISGSAFASIIGATLAFLSYLYAVPTGLRQSLLYSTNKGSSSQWKSLLTLKRLCAAAWVGANDSVDEFGNTLILWAVGMIGVAALAANNINILLNYIIVIPLIGIGNGANVMVSRAALTQSSVTVIRSVVASIAVSLGFSWLIFGLLWVAAPSLLSTIGLQAYGDTVYTLSVDVSRLIILYAVAFSISFPVSRALQALGYQKRVARTRLWIMFGGSVPAAFLIATLSDGDPDYLGLIWVSLSAFEAIVGLRLLYLLNATLKTTWKNAE